MFWNATPANASATGVTARFPAPNLSPPIEPRLHPHARNRGFSTDRIQMTADSILQANAGLRDKPALEIVKWAIAQADGHAIVSTNFRPYEAVILHLCVQTQPDIPVLWADHGYNRPATYRHAEQLRKLLNLNLKAYLPGITAAHRDAVYGELPTPDDEKGLKQFSALMKLEPFQRGMKELAPKVWITALRRVQNANRAGLDIVSRDGNFNTLKVSPAFGWSDADMEHYLEQHHLPNEWDYFDPAKAEDKRECGLHASWGAAAVVSAGAGI
jgi:phosphoadenosine phosphosulfate reductase